MKNEIITIAILILIAVIGAYFIGLKDKEEYTGKFTTYTVMPNETLWSIASDIESDKDIRDIIYTIKKDNNMTESVVYALQELQLRAEY